MTERKFHHHDHIISMVNTLLDHEKPLFYCKMALYTVFSKRLHTADWLLRGWPPDWGAIGLASTPGQTNRGFLEYHIFSNKHPTSNRRPASNKWIQRLLIKTFYLYLCKSTNYINYVSLNFIRLLWVIITPSVTNVWMTLMLSGDVTTPLP